MGEMARKRLQDDEMTGLQGKQEIPFPSSRVARRIPSPFYKGGIKGGFYSLSRNLVLLLSTP